jgi:mono/diheme cytochrome c family protein
VPELSTSTPAPEGDIVALGERLYQKEAGGIGCQYCHGQDARGDVGPNIRGKSLAAILQAVGTIPNMQMMANLTDEEFEAIAAYLETLTVDDMP